MRVLRSTRGVTTQLKVGIRSFSNSSQIPFPPLCITIDDDEFTPYPSSLRTNGSHEKDMRELEYDAKLKEMEDELKHLKTEYSTLQDATAQLSKDVPKAIQKIHGLEMTLKKVNRENGYLKDKLASSQSTEKQKSEKLVAQRKKIEQLKITLDENVLQFEQQQTVAKERVIDLRVQVAAMECYMNEYKAALCQIKEKETEISVARAKNMELTAELCNIQEKLERSKESVEKLQSEALELKRKNQRYENEIVGLKSRIKKLEQLNTNFVKNSTTVLQLNEMLLAQTENNADAKVSSDADGFGEGSRRMVTRSVAAMISKPPLILKPFRKISRPRESRIKRGSQYHAVDTTGNALGSGSHHCICGKKFVKKKGLIDHVQLYGYEQSLICCTQCEKAYVNYQRLREHEKRIHNMQ